MILASHQLNLGVDLVTIYCSYSPRYHAYTQSHCCAQLPELCYLIQRSGQLTICLASCSLPTAQMQLATTQRLHSCLGHRQHQLLGQLLG